MKNTFLAVVAGLGLMACSPSTEPTPAAPVEPAAVAPEQTPPTTPPPVDPALEDTCNKAQYSALIGKPATDAGVPPASATVRIIKPGDQVTMDFSPTRLNIDLDDAGVITTLRCG